MSKTEFKSENLATRMGGVEEELAKIDTIHVYIGNNNNTITISNVLNKYSTFVIRSANNGTVYNQYEIVISNTPVGDIAVINKIESSAVNVKLSFSRSGNNLIITNSGNYGAVLHILMY